MDKARNTHEELSNAYKILGGKGPLRIPTRRRKDNIKMTLKK
jgi:hypothetical protein